MKNNDTKQLVVLQVLIFLILYVMFQNVVMVNLKKRVTSNEIKIKTAEREYLDGVKSINSMEKSYRKYYNLLYTKDYISNKLIAPGEERYLGETITNLSIENGIKLSNITFSDTMSGDNRKYILKTNFNTDFYTLKSFLNSIDELEKDINLDDITISKNATDLDISASFSIYISK